MKALIISAWNPSYSSQYGFELQHIKEQHRAWKQLDKCGLFVKTVVNPSTEVGCAEITAFCQEQVTNTNLLILNGMMNGNDMLITHDSQAETKMISRSFLQLFIDEFTRNHPNKSLVILLNVQDNTKYFSTETSTITTNPTINTTPTSNFNTTTTSSTSNINSIPTNNTLSDSGFSFGAETPNTTSPLNTVTNATVTNATVTNTTVANAFIHPLSISSPMQEKSIGLNVSKNVIVVKLSGRFGPTFLDALQQELFESSISKKDIMLQAILLRCMQMYNYIEIEKTEDAQDVLLVKSSGIPSSFISSTNSKEVYGNNILMYEKGELVEEKDIKSFTNPSILQKDLLHLLASSTESIPCSVLTLARSLLISCMEKGELFSYTNLKKFLNFSFIGSLHILCSFPLETLKQVEFPLSIASSMVVLVLKHKHYHLLNNLIFCFRGNYQSIIRKSIREKLETIPLHELLDMYMYYTQPYMVSLSILAPIIISHLLERNNQIRQNQAARALELRVEEWCRLEEDQQIAIGRALYASFTGISSPPRICSQLINTIQEILKGSSHFSRKSFPIKPANSCFSSSSSSSSSSSCSSLEPSVVDITSILPIIPFAAGIFAESVINATGACYDKLYINKQGDFCDPLAWNCVENETLRVHLLRLFQNIIVSSKCNRNSVLVALQKRTTSWISNIFQAALANHNIVPESKKRKASIDIDILFEESIIPNREKESKDDYFLPLNRDQDQWFMPMFAVCHTEQQQYIRTVRTIDQTNVSFVLYSSNPSDPRQEQGIELLKQEIVEMAKTLAPNHIIQFEISSAEFSW